MSEEISTDKPSLLLRVDGICDRFERAWRKGDQPRIEDYLTDVEVSEQVPLLRELLRVELEYRVKAGEPITLEQYQQRFPLHADLVAVLVKEALGSRSTDIDSEKSTGNATATSGETGPYIPGSESSSDPFPGTGADGNKSDVPRVLGDYELLDRLGKGGMGVVYRARQRSADRIVALKVIRPERLEDLPPEQRQEWLRRFRAEGQAAARVDHENVVTVHEVGEADGQLFYSMRYVDGRSLADMLREDGPMPDRRAAAYLEPVARALHHVHSHGILHRDLKPGNILVDGSGRPLVADFGLAKWLSGEPNTIQTRGALGTPEYMAPEQARNAALAEPATDVYSLGATLYALLTGRPPFQAPDPVETMRQVIDKEPVPPRRLNPAIARDLETVCLKCLDKQPGKRYGSAEELACDLKSFLEGKPIKARPIGWAGRSLKWTRRRPAIAGLLAAVVLLIAGGFAGIYSQYLRVVDEKNEVVHQKKLLDERLDFTRRMLMNAQLMRVAGLYERFPDKGRDLLEDTDACPVELRDFAWGFFYGQRKRDRFTLTLKRPGPGQSVEVAVSPDGKMVAVGVDRTVMVWNVESGKSVATLADHTASVYCLAFSPDAKTLASGDVNGTIVLWEVATWRLRLICGGHTQGVICLAFSPDGLALAAMHVMRRGPSIDLREKAVDLWDTVTGELRTTFVGYILHYMAFSPDGRSLAFGREDISAGKMELQLWEPASGMLRTIRTGKTRWGPFAFTPDGKALLAAGSTPRDDASKEVNEEIWRFDLESGKGVPSITGFKPEAFSPDCKTAACRENGFVVRGEVTLLNVDTGKVRTILRLDTGKTEPFSGQVSAVAFSFDGKTLAAAGLKDDDTAGVTVWNVQSGRERVVLQPYSGSVRDMNLGLVHIALSPDGKILVSGVEKNTVGLWDPISAKQIGILAGNHERSSQRAFSRDGNTLASGEDKTVMLWDLETRKVRTTLEGHSGTVWSLVFSPDGQTLASADSEGTIKLWDLANGEERATLKVDSGNNPISMVFTHDGTTLISAAGATINLWDLASEKVVATLEGHTGLIFCLALAPDGKTLASGGWDRTVRLWDLSTRSLRSTANVLDLVFSLAYTSDSKTIAAAVNDLSDNPEAGAIKLLDVATFHERGTIERCGALFLVFTPDGNSLISRGLDGAIRMWDGRTDR